MAADRTGAHPPVWVTVDVVLLTVRAGRLAVLLVERGAEPFEGCWALPGGFVAQDEDLDAAARRELAEETGIRTGAHLEQLRSYGRPGRDPRGRIVSVAYLALVPELPAPVAASDARGARLCALDELAAVDLAFDHAEILGDAVERARAKLEYTTLATAFVDEAFTLGELRRVYEAVWGVPLHEGNFRRKVRKTEGFVEPAEVGTRSTGGRPAQLYRAGTATQLHPPILRPTTDD
jgi:8-oxo-dGTP diphosphatase